MVTPILFGSMRKAYTSSNNSPIPEALQRYSATAHTSQRGVAIQSSSHGDWQRLIFLFALCLDILRAIVWYLDMKYI
ncbi:hypothetical protein TNCT_116711 [Trichonephila clavata]|uniref:Uncharacterized protein n=1 Tax=Trichonephila clavata TaxID=2740835 RepID=A0A8X6H1F1_TRICU|nr:hypothetical protein TNCT_116711 [Trichonephila clavata]